METLFFCFGTRVLFQVDQAELREMLNISSFHCVRGPAGGRVGFEFEATVLQVTLISSFFSLSQLTFLLIEVPVDRQTV